jgi:hypothetical protein
MLSKVENFVINLILNCAMKEILKAVLVDASSRSAGSLESLAAEQAEFLTWG